jgi:HPt (histidine-containing phosphotransfer) domain-containing protein
LIAWISIQKNRWPLTVTGRVIIDKASDIETTVNIGNMAQKLLRLISGLLAHRDGKSPAAAPGKTAAGNHPETGTVSAHFSSELFASLLLELSEHRQALLDAQASQDIDALGRCAHKLLGAVVYCDLPELTGALGKLQEVIRSGEINAITPACNASVQAIEVLLAKSGLAS